MKSKTTLLFLISFLTIISSCKNKPTKTEALNYYELIYQISFKTRKGEINLLKETLQFYKNEVASNNDNIDSVGLQLLINKNEQLLNDFLIVKQDINSLHSFDFKKDLRAESSIVFDKQIKFHKTTFINLLNSYKDGIITPEELLENKKVMDSYEEITSSYKHWKAIRKEFCNEFGIEYSDIKALADKYEKK